MSFKNDKYTIFENGKSNSKVKKILVICCLPRTGSSLMCRQLKSGGIGFPNEYFNESVIKAARDIWKFQNLEEYSELLLNNMTSENGVFSIKLHWHHFKRYKNIIERKIFSAAETKHIFLTRMDIKKQAISWYKSSITGIWGQESNRKAALESSKDKSQNKNSIMQCARKIYRGEVMWRCYFSENNIDPLRIYYEDYATHQKEYFERIAGMLEIETTPPKPEEKSVPKELAKFHVEVKDFCKLLERDLKIKSSPRRRIRKLMKSISHIFR